MLPAERNSCFLHNLNSRVLDTNHSDLWNARFLTSHFYQAFLVRAGLVKVTLKHVTSLSRQFHDQSLTSRFCEIQTAEHLGRVASKWSTTSSAGTNLSAASSVTPSGTANTRMRLYPFMQTMHHRSPRQLLQSMQGYLNTGLQHQVMSEAVEPAPESDSGEEVDQAPTSPTTKPQPARSHVE